MMTPRSLIAVMRSLSHCRTHKGTGERRVTREDLERVVHLCQQDAAHELNIGVTRFKTACRQLGFSSWPYRRIKSIRALKQTIQESGDLDPVSVSRD